MENNESQGMDRQEKLNDITRVSKDRGFFFPTADIYGGRAGFFTYGHLGKMLKRNWESYWKRMIFSLSDNFYEIQSNNILPGKVFEASGHLDSFNDPLTQCKKCGKRFRADKILEAEGVEDAEGLSLEEMNKEFESRGLGCSDCGSGLSEVKWFNMMFEVPIGFEKEKGYLTPETAQSAYLAFKNEFNATRGKLPLGLVIVDKAFRNEISPRQMFFRLREFSQAELQIFFDPDKIDEHGDWVNVKDSKIKVKLSSEDEAREISCSELNEKHGIPKYYVYHLSKVQDFYMNVMKLPEEKFRLRELSGSEKAFYNKYHYDVEVYLDTLGGFKEVGGVHYRTDHDLKGHQKVSSERMKVSHESKKFIPHVLELSFGIDRNIWALLDVFHGQGKEGTMFKFPDKFSPYKAAVLPLVKKREEFVEISIKIHSHLKQEGFSVYYDETSSIGKRYARQDEIGTPYCITVDDQTLEDGSVTLRDRDSLEQKRVSKENLDETLDKLVKDKLSFEEL
ncbi:MAG: glycine--tRNA ligase [Candidatus Pacearchaeota archaeon]